MAMNSPTMGPGVPQDGAFQFKHVPPHAGQMGHPGHMGAVMAQQTPPGTAAQQQQQQAQQMFANQNPRMMRPMNMPRMSSEVLYSKV